MSVVPDLAAFIADNPFLSEGELRRELEDRWGSLSAREAAEALAIAQQIIDARGSAETDLHRLINRTRVLHGTATATCMLHRYQSGGGTRVSG
jgi:hypothetical protein